MNLIVPFGQIVAVVGESRSRKATAAAILRLLLHVGRITLVGIVLTVPTLLLLIAEHSGSICCRCILYVLQDPMTNLNSVWKVGCQISEALRSNADCFLRRKSVE